MPHGLFLEANSVASTSEPLRASLFDFERPLDAVVDTSFAQCGFIILEYCVVLPTYTQKNVLRTHLLGPLQALCHPRSHENIIVSLPFPSVCLFEALFVDRLSADSTWIKYSLWTV
uniref:Uncharacterized protein n=1 Tax=Steinernema glaseri TaxID=37863 RepID=A0A1I7Y0F6_9BILA